MFVRLGLLLSLVLISLPCFAEKIEFPEEELARESVLPVFDRPEPVKSRNVVKQGAIELEPNFGFTLNNPFYSGLNGGLQVGYHMDEYHGFFLLGAFFSPEKSQYAVALEKDDACAPGGKCQDFDGFPVLEYSLLAGYEYTPYYGKISLTKQSVLNLDLFLTGGIGMVGIGGEGVFAGTVGIGQRFYFGKKFGVKVNMRALMYSGPDYTSVENFGATEKNSWTIDEFEKEFTAHFLLTVGAVFLL